VVGRWRVEAEEEREEGWRERMGPECGTEHALWTQLGRGQRRHGSRRPCHLVSQPMAMVRWSTRYLPTASFASKGCPPMK